MANHITPITDLTMENRNWTVHALLVEMSAIRTAKTSGKPYRRYVFVDTQGTKLMTCAFSADMEAYDHCLKLFKTYEIFAKQGKDYKTDLPNFNSEIQLYLNRHYSIVPVETDPISSLTGKPSFKKLSCIVDCLATNEYIDVIGVLIDVAEQKQRNKR
ncbi:uncharacterized protein LOC127244126 [Andrographis paniculata]|uniref:uncharacterized protein LOC127244126 n=1 Tax=Andrographis paniculata TaxID=175694 RepID=UPI0021E75F43|nr:uncharacterized protein LOC127244126 [Andrographis paniculata]